MSHIRSEFVRDLEKNSVNPAIMLPRINTAGSHLHMTIAIGGPLNINWITQNQVKLKETPMDKTYILYPLTITRHQQNNISINCYSMTPL